MVVPKARVLTVDDDSSFRRLIRRVVETTPGFVQVGEAASGEDAVSAADELEPDLVVMDVFMPGIGGIAAADCIKERRPATVVMLVSTTHPDDLPSGAADGSADAVVWKRELHPSLLGQIWQRHRD